MNDVVAFAVDQATTVTMILMEKGLKRDQIYFNVGVFPVSPSVSSFRGF